MTNDYYKVGDYVVYSGYAGKGSKTVGTIVEVPYDSRTVRVWWFILGRTSFVSCEFLTKVKDTEFKEMNV